MTKVSLLFLLGIFSLPVFAHGVTTREAHDVVVIGATPAGIAAAINAAKSGASVALVEELGYVGGLPASGMSNTDFKSLESIQGTYREFMRRVEQHYARTYGARSKQVEVCYHGAFYEPKVARKVFEEMLAERSKVRVLLRHRFNSVVLEGSEEGRSRIRSVRLTKLPSQEPVELEGKVFVDATYEGDLMAAAGSPYRVGKESRQEYGELFAGVLYYSGSWSTGPSSGGRILPGSTGEADKHVQCYNFRFCMTMRLELRVPIKKPDDYRRAEFLPLLEFIKSGTIKAVSEEIVAFREMPNEKYGVNDLLHSPFSLALTENDEWPDGTPEVRARIFNRYRSFTLGLFYFLQNDPEVPKSIRTEARRWGLSKDEFTDSNNFPQLLYVREARRMVGEYVFVERDTQNTLDSVRSPLHTDSIATGDYSLDCHGDQPPSNYHPGITEGAFNYPVVPFQVPYKAMLPKNVDGLLVPVAVSASHVGFNSLRMEPTWTALGQAAGLAAAIAIRQGTAVRRVNVPELQQRLHEAGAITVYFSDVAPDSPYYREAQHFGTRGFFHHVVDMRQASFRIGTKTTGQYREATPYHAAELHRPVDDALAKRWIAMLNDAEAQRRASADLALRPTVSLTRGEFLARLYRYSKP